MLTETEQSLTTFCVVCEINKRNFFKQATVKFLNIQLPFGQVRKEDVYSLFGSEKNREILDLGSVN